MSDHTHDIPKPTRRLRFSSIIVVALLVAVAITPVETSTFLMRLLLVSAMMMFPKKSRATPEGPDKLADRAASLSPVYPGVPFPATVVA